MTEPGGSLGDRFVGLTRPDQHRILVTLVQRGVVSASEGASGDPAAPVSSTPDAVPAEVSFAELGLERDAGTRLRGFLSHATGLSLPTTLLSDAPTPSAVAEFLWDRLAGMPADDMPSPNGADGAMPSPNGAAVTASEWQIERLDLDRYLARIGVGGQPAPTLEWLRRIQWAHAATIGFHNIDVLLGRPISHELSDIQRKLVRPGGGGSCVEHGLLLAAALQRLGFSVTRLAGRPRLGRPAVLPLTHMSLLVMADGTSWLVDVGLGGEGPTEPVPIFSGVPAGQRPWRWRVRALEDSPAPGEHVLQVEHVNKRRTRWVDLYSFDLRPQRFVDYLVAVYYSVTYPGIPFTHMIVAHRVTSEERHVVSGGTYTRTTADGRRVARSLESDSLGVLLHDVFGLTLTESQLETVRRRVGMSPTSVAP